MSMPIHHRKTIPTVKFQNGNIMVCWCFSAKVTDNIQVVESRMKAEEYQDIYDSNLQESVVKLELSNELVFNKTTILTTQRNL